MRTSKSLFHFPAQKTHHAASWENWLFPHKKWPFQSPLCTAHSHMHDIRHRALCHHSLFKLKIISSAQHSLLYVCGDDQSKAFVCGHVMAQKTCPSPTHTHTPLVWRTMARLSDNPKINFLMDWPKKCGAAEMNKNIYLRQIISPTGPRGERRRGRGAHRARQKMWLGFENSSACVY